MKRKRLEGGMGFLVVVLLWRTQWFIFPSTAAAFLNSLPEARALEAKVYCWGDWPCYVVYRTELEVSAVRRAR